MKRIIYRPISQSAAILALMALVACSKLLDDFEYEEKSSKLVVNAILNPDSVISIHLSSSKSFNPPGSFMYLENADMELFENDQTLGHLSSMGSGYYTLPDTYPQEGATYKVMVTTEAYEPVWAETTIPHKVENLEVEDRMLTSTNQDGYSSTKMQYLLSYKVPNTETVFYSTSISSQKQEMVLECVERETPWFNGYYEETDSCYYVASESGATLTEYIYLYSNSSLIKFTKSWGSYQTASFDDDNFSKKIYFSSKNYNSNQLSLALNIDYYSLFDNIDNEITIWTDSFDEVLYNFMYSLAKIEEVDGDPFAEKVSVYTNVNGGLGIFGSCTSSSHVIRYDEEYIDSITPKF
ncbi:MAG: DUF4249 domain-containing protein [Bacteroidales bacterium]|nr:DUF4249 domain-containing protein [Bacteroidales bacterium]